MVIRAALLLPLALSLAAAQPFYTVIGNLDHDSVLIAWGRADGSGNLIGRTAQSHGDATVRVAGPTEETRKTEKTWVEIDDLKPDAIYSYDVRISGKRIGGGSFRTWPEKADRLCFFVIGDYGDGSSGQRRVADAMRKEFEKRSTGDNPVRFVLTTGDNIYADINFGGYSWRSGDQDWHWDSKFFRPYAEIIKQIPWYPTIGNHDGNSTENRADLDVYLDNFFLPDNKPHRWYEFSFGGLADFFALDTSNNTESGRRAPVYLVEGEQFEWLSEQLPKSKALWKIPYAHHPPFNAGPRHPGDFVALRHFVDLFRRSGVKVMFSGHEHNFQFSEENAATSGIRFVITGAGGSLRAGDIRSRMAAAHIAGWASQRHFLVVEIYGPLMKITPVSDEPVRVVNPRGQPIEMPIQVTVPVPAGVQPQPTSQ